MLGSYHPEIREMIQPPVSIHQAESLTLSFLCMHHLDMMLDMNFLLIEERVT